MNSSLKIVIHRASQAKVDQLPSSAAPANGAFHIELGLKTQQATCGLWFQHVSTYGRASSTFKPFAKWIDKTERYVRLFKAIIQIEIYSMYLICV